MKRKLIMEHTFSKLVPRPAVAVMTAKSIYWELLVKMRVKQVFLEK